MVRGDYSGMDDRVRRLSHSSTDKLLNKSGDADGVVALCVLSRFLNHEGEFERCKTLFEQQAKRLERELASEQASYWVVHAGTIYAAALIGLGDYEEAESLLSLSAQTCLHRSQDDSFQSILGEISYQRGLIGVERGELNRAQRCFAEANQRVLDFPVDRANEGCPERNYFVSRTLILGLAPLHFKRGELTIAQSFVASGKVLADGCEDGTLKAMADVIGGAILLTAAGDAPSGINQSIMMLERAFHALNQHHGAYQASAAYYLALARLANGDIEHARALIEQLRARNSDDARWTIQAELVLGRISLQTAEFQRAKQLSQRCIEHARKVGSREVIIRSLLLLAEARSALREWDAARQELSAALEMCNGMDIPELTAMCHLQLCRVCVNAGRFAEAEQHLRHWRAFAPRIENGFLLSLSQEIEASLLGRANDFVISRDTPDLDYRRHTESLQKFLCYLALERAAGNASEAANLLGVTRATLYNLLSRDKYRPSVKRLTN